jgi:hypothetical protein
MQGDAPWRALEWREWCGTAGHDPLRDGLLVGQMPSADWSNPRVRRQGGKHMLAGVLLSLKRGRLWTDG